MTIYILISVNWIQVSDKDFAIYEITVAFVAFICYLTIASVNLFLFDGGKSASTDFTINVQIPVKAYHDTKTAGQNLFSIWQPAFFSI